MYRILGLAVVYGLAVASCVTAQSTDQSWRSERLDQYGQPTYRCYQQPGHIYHTQSGYAYYVPGQTYCVQTANRPQAVYQSQATNTWQSAEPPRTTYRSQPPESWQSASPPAPPRPSVSTNSWQPASPPQTVYPSQSANSWQSANQAPSNYRSPLRDSWQRDTASGNTSGTPSQVTAKDVFDGLRNAAIVSQGVESVLGFLGDVWDFLAELAVVIF